MATNFAPDGNGMNISDPTHPSASNLSKLEISDNMSASPESTHKVVNKPDVSQNVINNVDETQDVDISMSSCQDTSCDKPAGGAPSKISESSMQNDRISHNDTASVSSTSASFGGSQTCYSCVCGATFSKTTDLAAHKRWTCKLAEKKCQCDICQGWFAHEQSLRRHMKHAHGGIFPCDSCNLRFHNKMKLTRHWMEAHYDDDKSGEAKLKCYICLKDGFESKYDLECHLLAHKYAKEKKSTPTSTEAPADISDCGVSMKQADRSNDLSAHSFSLPPGSWGNHMQQSEPFSPYFPPHSGHHGLFGFFPHHGHHSGGHRGGHFFPHHHPHYPPHMPPWVPPPPPPLPLPPPPPPVPSHHGYPHASSQPDFQSTPSSPSPTPEHDHHPPPPPPPPQPQPAPPHHNHQPPPFYSVEAYPNMKKFHKHKNKMKWKHYFKSVMAHMPSYWFSRPPASGPWGCHAGGHHLPGERTSQSPTQAQSLASSRVEDGMMTCEFCGETIHIKYMAGHKKRGCPVLCVHKCRMCGKAFASERLLWRHMSKQGHTNIGDTTSCPSTQGDGESSSIFGLQEKLNSVLNFQRIGASGNSSQVSQAAEVEQFPSRSIPSISITKASDDMPSDSSECSMKDRTEFQNSRNANSVNEAEYEKDLVIDEDTSKSFMCVVCKCSLEMRRDIRQHLQDHLSHVESIQKVQEWKERSAKFFHDKEFSEGSSNASFSTSTDFLSTTSIPIESDGTSHISSQSTVLSETDKWLKPHGKHKPTKHKRQVFPCSVCSEVFAFRKDLHFHMKEKHKEHSLECPVCHKTFSWANRVKFYERHMKSHYGVSVFKYKCHVCNKTFLENHKFQAHMATHKSEFLHICSICGKGYGNKSSLIRHQRKHTGDKPHRCDMCHESFLEKRELIRHSATHTGTSAFMCSDCGQGFTLKTSLMKHRKRKHPQ